jgi:hypothetical protein
MGNPVVTAILAVLRLGIGLILLRLALDSRYRNLHWLAAVFYLNFLNLFLRGSDLWPASQVLMIVIQICLAMFTHATFYQHRRSPVAWVIAGLVVAGSASLYLSLRVPSYRGLQPIALLCALNWFWHALIAWQVGRTLGSDRSVEDWVKMRYGMVVTYAVAMGVLFVLPTWRSGVLLFRVAWWVTLIVALLLQYLAWGMPAALRRYLNRNYRSPVPAEQALSMTDEDILRALEKPAR